MTTGQLKSSMWPHKTKNMLFWKEWQTQTAPKCAVLGNVLRLRAHCPVLWTQMHPMHARAGPKNPSKAHGLHTQPLCRGWNCASESWEGPRSAGMLQITIFFSSVAAWGVGNKLQLAWKPRHINVSNKITSFKGIFITTFMNDNFNISHSTTALSFYWRINE